MKEVLFLLIVCTLFATCNQRSETVAGSDPANSSRDTIACPPGGSKLDISKIEQITGMKGVEKNGDYKITVPQNDLHIVVDGFKIIPPMGLGSWAAFAPCGDSAMVMGDIILTTPLINLRNPPIDIR